MTTSMIPSQGTLASRAALAAALGLGATLLSAGCAQEPLCAELDDCGGPMPVGDWSLSSPAVQDANGDWVLPDPLPSPVYGSCSEDLYVPATDNRLLGGEITPARTPTIEPALWDWCSLLLTGAAADETVVLKPPRFYYESQMIGDANVRYVPDDPTAPDVGQFTTGMARTGRFTFDFPAMCVRAFGAIDLPDLTIDPSGAPVQVCERIQVKVASSGLGEGSYPNADCYANLDASDPRLTPEQAERQRQNVEKGYPADPLGCLCEFDVTEAGSPSGTYRKRDNVIVHTLNGNYPTRATFCVQGNRLQLTGFDGSYLFNIPGLRTMDLGLTPAPAPAPAAPPPP